MSDMQPEPHDDPAPEGARPDAPASAPGPAPAAQAAAPAAEVAAPPHHGRSVLWILAVFGAFLALGALWFAIFGNPQVVGPETTPAPASATAGGSATSAPSSAPATQSAAPITLADVKDVLAQLDYVESSDSSTTEYNNTLTHVLAGVDVLTFAQNTLQASPKIWWHEPASDALVYQTGTEKSDTVAASVAAYLKRGSTVGEATALGDVMGVRIFPPDVNDRNLPDSQLEVIGQGLEPLGLMFGAHDADDSWQWHIEDVAVTGPNSADITYSAKTKPGTRWKFLDPSVRYTKHLTFIRSDGGQWRLAGWTNYAQVAKEFHDNVSNPGEAFVDEWWGNL